MLAGWLYTRWDRLAGVGNVIGGGFGGLLVAGYLLAFVVVRRVRRRHPLDCPRCGREAAAPGD